MEIRTQYGGPEV